MDIFELVNKCRQSGIFKECHDPAQYHPEYIAMVRISFNNDDRIDKHTKNKLKTVKIDGYQTIEECNKIKWVADHRNDIKNIIYEYCDDYKTMKKAFEKQHFVTKAFQSVSDQKQSLNVQMYDDNIYQIVENMIPYYDCEHGIIITEGNIAHSINVKSNAAISTQKHRKWCKEEKKIQNFDKVFGFD